MERFYRFELAFDGEPQGVGFLQGLDEVGLPESVEDALYELFSELPVPILSCPDFVSFWFTRDGLDYFGDAINTVAVALADFNWQLMAGVMEDDANGFAVYHDAYQAAFLTEYLATNYSKFAEVSRAEDALELKSLC